MGTFNGNANGGIFSAPTRSAHKRAGAGLQILISLLLLADLFLLYTIIMQMTHLQKAFEASDTVNLVLLIALCVWLLHYSKYGEKLYLIGVNPQAAEYSGINTRAVIMSTYILAAVSAAVAGTLLTSNINSAKYNNGAGYTLDIITVVVLGGTLNTGGKGSIPGTVLASLIICLLRRGLTLCFGVSNQNLDLPVGIILVIVVLGREIAGKHMISGLIRRVKKR